MSDILITRNCYNIAPRSAGSTSTSPATTPGTTPAKHGKLRTLRHPKCPQRVIFFRFVSWPLLALGLILYVTSDPRSNIVANLSGATAFLLLCVFTVACVVLRGKRDLNGHVFFSSPGQLPIVAALLCAFLARPWVGRNIIQYQIAGGLMAIGVVLWLITWLINRRTNTREGEPVGIQNFGKDDQVPPPPPASDPVLRCP
jgi:F0F1-type ATP synthase assembly protein I